MTLKAKTVIPDRYWILRDHTHKVGNIECDDNGFSLRINNSTSHFKTLDSLCQQVSVTFETTSRKEDEDEEKNDGNQIYGYPTNGVPHNAVWDVKKQIPIWTREERSKSWQAAGWFRVKQHRTWRVMFCPKAILLDRYEYQGPYHSRREAQIT